MTIRKLALIAPVLFILHVLEEAPGFVAWFNSLVPRGITQNTFLMVNAVAFTITVLIALLVAAAPEPASGLVLAAWVGFLMLANGVLHLVGTIAHARYCPGVVTGTLLYLPYGVLLLRKFVRDLKLHPMAVLGAAALGAVPMPRAWIPGRVSGLASVLEAPRVAFSICRVRRRRTRRGSRVVSPAAEPHIVSAAPDYHGGDGGGAGMIARGFRRRSEIST